MQEQDNIWALLETIPDPEIPVLSVVDLGIVRGIGEVVPNESIDITITPTYSGCPAMDMIGKQIRWALQQKGFKKVTINTVLSPAWSTDWISEAGKEKLKAFGIAPPAGISPNNGPELFAPAPSVQCPLCNSFHTSRISEFGSTACKALYRCNDCREPFDHFKCH